MKEEINLEPIQHSLFSNSYVSNDSPLNPDEFLDYLANFTFNDGPISVVEEFSIGGLNYKKIINEFWTSRQRQANSIHEVSYRACFKPQLPNFFISRLTNFGDIIFDPFGGRGTTIIEASLLNRSGISNDINPLSAILAEPRVHPPRIEEIKNRLINIPFYYSLSSDIDLSMFYHHKTLSEIVSLKKYIYDSISNKTYDGIDAWIRMVATNRLTGHSKGFFSVYTLPPNQAVTQTNQIKINVKRKQIPDYRDVKKIIISKSKSLLRDITPVQMSDALSKSIEYKFLNENASNLVSIRDNTVQLTVTSPPFLDIVNYKDDNWLRCWFNNIDSEKMAKNISIFNSVEKWSSFMFSVFSELYRITKPGGWVAFEVGEVRRGKIKLDDFIAPIGIDVGFKLLGVMINQQTFTKTSNAWGVQNNESGTNTNRIVIFYKE